MDENKMIHNTYESLCIRIRKLLVNILVQEASDWIDFVANVLSSCHVQNKLERFVFKELQRH